MTATDPERARASRRRRNRNIGSSLLFAALTVALVAIAITYLEDEEDPPPTAPIPTAAGRNEAINVMQALEAQGLAAAFGPGGATVAGLTPPGQRLNLGDATLYFFIYDSVADREAESATLDEATLTLKTPSGTPIAGAGTPEPDVHLVTGSNVIAILVGGTPEQIEQVDAAIASLP